MEPVSLAPVSRELLDAGVSGHRAYGIHVQPLVNGERGNGFDELDGAACVESELGARPRPAIKTMQISLAERLVSDISNASCEESLHRALIDTAIAIGFDHFALAYDRHACAAEPANILIHDYPEAWASAYIGFDLGGADPVRRAGERSMTGFAWRDLDRYIPLARGDLHMLSVGREHGIGDGYTVPRHLPGDASGSCSFVVEPGRELPDAMLHVAEIAGASALTVARRLAGASRPAPRPSISDRQRECILWSARGKTAGEIATILDIAEATVIQHFRIARERYDVHNGHSLILCALFDGLIGFADIFGWREPT